MTAPTTITYPGSGAATSPITPRKWAYGLKTAAQTSIIAGTDFGDADNYPSTVTPTSAVPDLTYIESMAGKPGNTTNRFQASGANVVTGNSLALASGKKIVLPAAYKLPALGSTNSLDGDYLIILWLKGGTQTLTSGQVIVCGWGSDFNSNCNWMGYLNFGSNNLNIKIGNGPGGTVTGFGNSTSFIQVALHVKVVSGTCTLDVYKNGVVATTASASLTAIPQPGTGQPELGGTQVSGPNGPFVGGAGSVDIYNMTTEAASANPRGADEIVALDYQQNLGRFS